MEVNSDDKSVDSRELNREIEELQSSHGSPDLTFKKPLKTPVKYGVYLWWPAPVEDWVHPEDHAIAEELIPSNRVFRREDFDEEYARLTYGSYSMRVRPVIWLEIPADGYEIGDQIEVKSRMGRSRPFIATIVEIRWDQENQRILYMLEQNGRKLRRPYSVDEFQIAQALESHLDQRKLMLISKTRIN